VATCRHPPLLCFEASDRATLEDKPTRHSSPTPSVMTATDILFAGRRDPDRHGSRTISCSRQAARSLPQRSAACAWLTRRTLGRTADRRPRTRRQRRLRCRCIRSSSCTRSMSTCVLFADRPTARAGTAGESNVDGSAQHRSQSPEMTCCSHVKQHRTTSDHCRFLGCECVWVLEGKMPRLCPKDARERWYTCILTEPSAVGAS